MDLLKPTKGDYRYKRPFLAQTYDNKGATSNAKILPITQKFTQLLIFASAASSDDMCHHTQDITESHVHSPKPFERKVYICAPFKMNLPPNVMLRVMTREYGISESDLYWYVTYLDDRIKTLNIVQ